MKSKDEEMLRELNKVISYAHVMLLSSQTSEDAIYWKGYNDAIDELLNIVRKDAYRFILTNDMLDTKK